MNFAGTWLAFHIILFLWALVLARPDGAEYSRPEGDVVLNDGGAQGQPDDILFDEEYKMTSGEEGNIHERLIRKVRTISSGEHAPFQVDLVSFHDREGYRERRSTYNNTFYTWPHRIPYMFAEDYPEKNRRLMKYVLKELMDHVCVVWEEVKDFDPNNNTFETNAYLVIALSPVGACTALVGRGYDNGPRRIQTCNSYNVMIHEMLHSLGVMHEQQGWARNKHLINEIKNLKTGFDSNYRRLNNPQVVMAKEFDPSSLMMYGKRSFTRNGLDIIIPFIEEEFKLSGGGHSNLQNIYDELNEVYKCKEKYCQEEVDCGLGYLAKIKGKCQCVCPDGLDPRHNCQKLEDETSGPTEWPDVPLTVLAAERDVCPEGFTPARLDIKGYRHPYMLKENCFTDGKITQFYTCSKKATADHEGLEPMPLGSYCMVKPRDFNQSGEFLDGSFLVTSEDNITTSGDDWGDWPIQDNLRTVDLKFSCRQDRSAMTPIELPTKYPFRLFREGLTCQAIKGMRSTYGLVVMFVRGTKASGKVPWCWKNRDYIGVGFCTYRPPNKYGCNEQVSLDADRRAVTITTPGFDTGQRDSNTRCLYHFSSPRGARIKVTFNEFNIDSDDLFKIRRFNKWSLSFDDYLDNYRKQFLTGKDFLFMEFWSGLSENSGKKGISFTAEVILKEDLCYNAEDRGQSYRGPRWVSEHFEECIPWKDAVDCDDFPFDGPEDLSLLSHNSCRNPGGSMDRPWCYVSVDRGMCRRQYCDVCNFMNAKDQIKGCPENGESAICENGMQRTKCAQTCSLTLDAASHKCGTPSIPADGTPTTDLKDTYDVGETVRVQCNLNPDPESAIEIGCTLDGWPSLTSACSDTTCEDKSSFCHSALLNYPDLCNNSRSKPIASQYCSKTCNEGCTTAQPILCEEPASDSYHRVSAANEILPGHAMEFACNAGLFLVGGTLKRACGSDGQLLGQEPACVPTPLSIRIGVGDVQERWSRIPLRKAILFDVDDYRIPADGTVTQWHFYGVQAGTVSFMVFRHVNATQTMQLVGHNDVTMDILNERWTYQVPSAEQIAVLKGDVYGVYPKGGLVAATPCDGYKEKIMNLRLQPAKKFEDLINGEVPFAQRSCIIPSVGVTIEPNFS